MNWLTGIIVRGAAWIVPAIRRDAWREEWLAELAASRQGVRRVLGAPIDAWALRRSLRASTAGWRSSLRTDVVQTFRMLRREPGHATTVVLCLAAGITAAVATFSVLNGVLYAEVAGVRDRATLSELHIAQTGVGPPFPPTTVADYEVISKSAPSSLSVAASSDIRSSGARIHLAVRIGDDAVPIVGQFVSGNFFDVSGTTPLAGRLLGAADDRPGVLSAVIAARFWRAVFDSAPGAIGSVVTISGQLVQIVGVAPEGYGGTLFREVSEGEPPEIWLPLAARTVWPGASPSYVSILVRHPDLSATDVERALSVGVRDITPFPGMHSPRPVVRPLGHGRDASSIEIAMIVAFIMAAPLVVVAISCANVANLRLAQAAARTREFAIRLSLGASRRQVVRLLVIEAIVLTSLATFVGWLATIGLIALSATAVLAVLPAPPALDWRVMAFAACLGGLVVTGAGLLPALAATRRVMAEGLRETTQAGGKRHGRLRRTLLVAQVGLSVALLVMAALFVRSLANTTGAATTDVTQELVVAQFDLARLGYDTPAAQRFSEDLVARVRSHGRVTAVGLSTSSLFRASGTGFAPPGRGSERWRAADVRRVSPEWFATLGVREQSGTLFSASDRHPSVAVVNRALAESLSAAGPIVGTVIETSGRPPVPLRIVGIVSDPPLPPGQRRPGPAIYIPFDVEGRRTADTVSGIASAGKRELVPTSTLTMAAATTGPESVPVPFYLYIRTSDPEAVIPELRRLITAIEPRAPWTRFATAESLIAEETSPMRLIARSLSGLGGVALLLAAAGVYAVMAYLVSMRTRELGVRAALGAGPGDLIRLVLGQTLRVTLIGLVVGLLIAFPAAATLRSALVGVSVVDPISLVPVVALLVVAAVGAAVLPARRAAAIDPASVLRAE